MNKILIAGLGNPGVEYVMTRHNIGFMVTDRLAADMECSSWRKEKNYLLSTGVFQQNEVCLIKPRTYMNLSGIAVLSALSRFTIPVNRLLVVVDDMALPFGKIRFRKQGSDGGHNGLASITEKLGRSDYPRLRIGIDKPPENIDAADYVLSGFSQEEAGSLGEIITKSAEGIKTFIEYGIEDAMNRFN